MTAKLISFIISRKAEGKFPFKLTLFFFSDGSLDLIIYFKKVYGFIIHNLHKAEFSSLITSLIVHSISCVMSKSNTNKKSLHFNSSPE